MSKRDRPSIMLRVEPDGRLAPETAYDEERLAEFRAGSVISADGVSQPRSDRLNRTYWMVLGAVVQATGKWETADKLNFILKIEFGHVETIQILGRSGAHEPSFNLYPRSLSDFSPDEFKAFVQWAFDWLVIETGINPDEIIAERKERPRLAYQRAAA